MSEKEPEPSNGRPLGQRALSFLFYAFVIYAVIYLIGTAMDAPPDQMNRVLDHMPPLRLP